MQRTSFVLLTAGILGAGTATADTFDYEVAFGYASSDSDTVSFPISGGIPQPTFGSSRSSTSDDDINLSGSWFYSGLNDEEGPRSRAEFLSRASSVSFTYSRADSDSESFSDFGGFPITSSGEATIDTFGLGLRHVWADSGWYALAAVARSDGDGSFSDSTGFSADTSFTADAYSAGFGKYLGPATTIDLSVSWVDVEGSSDESFALSFSHIGALGDNWQYGADVAIRVEDEDSRAYSGQLSVYPNRDVAFGMSVTLEEREIGLDIDGTTFAGFASWYFTDTAAVTAEITSGEVEALGFDADADAVSIGVSVRF